MGKQGSAKGSGGNFAETCFETSVGVWSARVGEKHRFLIACFAFSQPELSAHNPEVVGSSPASATRKETAIPIGMAFFFYPACVASFGSTSGFPEGSEGSAAGGR